MPAVKPISEMQRNAASLTEQAMRTKEPIYLTKHGKSAVVVIDAEEFDERMRYRDAIVAREQAVYAGIMRGHAEAQEGRTVSLSDALKQNDTSVAVRTARAEDAEALLAIYAPYVQNTAITFEYEVPSVGEFERRIRATLARYPYVVAERDGAPVGYAYASPFKERAAYDWAIETSIYVDRAARHKGVGRALHTALEQALRAQGVLNMCACIAVPAPAAPDAPADEHLDRNSEQFHAHLGYRLVGEFQACGYKFGRWYNMVWMEKMLGEHATDRPQPPVRPFDEVRPLLVGEGVLAS